MVYTGFQRCVDAAHQKFTDPIANATNAVYGEAMCTAAFLNLTAYSCLVIATGALGVIATVTWYRKRISLGILNSMTILLAGTGCLMRALFIAWICGFFIKSAACDAETLGYYQKVHHPPSGVCGYYSTTFTEQLGWVLLIQIKFLVVLQSWDLLTKPGPADMHPEQYYNGQFASEISMTGVAMARDLEASASTIAARASVPAVPALVRKRKGRRITVALFVFLTLSTAAQAYFRIAFWQDLNAFIAAGNSKSPGSQKDGDRDIHKAIMTFPAYYGIRAMTEILTFVGLVVVFLRLRYLNRLSLLSKRVARWRRQRILLNGYLVLCFAYRAMVCLVVCFDYTSSRLIDILNPTSTAFYISILFTELVPTTMILVSIFWRITKTRLSGRAVTGRNTVTMQGIIEAFSSKQHKYGARNNGSIATRGNGTFTSFARTTRTDSRCEPLLAAAEQNDDHHDMNNT